MRKGDPALTAERVCEFDRQVLEKLTLDEGVVPGQVRTHSVVVGNVYRGAPAEVMVPAAGLPICVFGLLNWGVFMTLKVSARN